MTINEFINSTTKAFSQAGINSARLDAQILLCDALNKNKSWLLANPEFELPEALVESVEPQISARVKRIPLAYIRERIEFYGRSFMVNSQVLIPRPETESIIELIKKYVRAGMIIDVGTGSGAIAITTALENPVLDVEACDVSPEALKVAAQNSKLLGSIKIKFFRSDLLSNATGQYDAVVANLPYVDPAWQVSPETVAEPKIALFASDGGLELIQRLIVSAREHIKPDGYLILEADIRQHAAIKKAAGQSSFKFIASDGLGLVFGKL